jgi:hypothetical protein
MCRWKENIKTDVKDIDCEAVGWNKLAQRRGLVNTVMDL